MRLNLLVSYAYWTDAWVEFFRRVKKNTSLMIDSGAFTAHFSGKKITLDGYCDMLDTVRDFAFSYIQLDVIGDAVGTRTNLLEMRRRGYEPMPVLTVDAPEADYDFFVDSTPHRRVCVAGGGTCAPAWFLARLERLDRRRPNGLVHALGFTPGVRVFHAPVSTIDSSSFSGVYRWGGICYYSALGGVLKLGCASPKSWNDLPREFSVFAQRSGIPLAHICDGRPRGVLTYRGMISVAAWMQYANECQKNGTTLFFAGTSPHVAILQLAPVVMNFHDGAFDYAGAVRDMKAILAHPNKVEYATDLLVAWTEREEP